MGERDINDILRNEGLDAARAMHDEARPIENEGAAILNDVRVPKPFFDVDAEAIPSAADRAGADVFAGADELELRPQTLNEIEDVSLAGPLDRAVEPDAARRREAASSEMSVFAKHRRNLTEFEAGGSR
jgi:hypothetical protein